MMLKEKKMLSHASNETDWIMIINLGPRDRTTY
jgi:hypothetical protein